MLECTGQPGERFQSTPQEHSDCLKLWTRQGLLYTMLSIGQKARRRFSRLKACCRRQCSSERPKGATTPVLCQAPSARSLIKSKNSTCTGLLRASDHVSGPPHYLQHTLQAFRTSGDPHGIMVKTMNDNDKVIARYHIA